jgi:hypothetical protein
MRVNAANLKANPENLQSQRPTLWISKLEAESTGSSRLAGANSSRINIAFEHVSAYMLQFPSRIFCLASLATSANNAGFSVSKRQGDNKHDQCPAYAQSHCRLAGRKYLPHI